MAENVAGVIQKLFPQSDATGIVKFGLGNGFTVYAVIMAYNTRDGNEVAKTLFSTSIGIVTTGAVAQQQ